MVIPTDWERTMTSQFKPADIKWSERPARLQHRFLVLRKLGQGTYGKVQLALNKKNNQEVAIKTIKKAKIESEEDMLRIRREIYIMTSIRHPHIIHINEAEQCDVNIQSINQSRVMVASPALSNHPRRWLSDRFQLSDVRSIGLMRVQYGSLESSLSAVEGDLFSFGALCSEQNCRSFYGVPPELPSGQRQKDRIVLGEISILCNKYPVRLNGRFKRTRFVANSSRVALEGSVNKNQMK
ncbi:protein kinase domain-containing protein [Trichonephila clavipes]|nr:protein kinase domain-containing protein [Trichonephila clavipes]